MKSLHSATLVACALLLAGCGMSALPTADGGSAARMPSALTQATAGDLSVELLTFGPLTVGQNRVFYRLTRGGTALTSASLAQKPLMQMMTMSHPCPLVDPASTANADGLFEGLLVFTMASTENEPWRLALDVAAGTEAPVSVDFGEVAVADSALKKIFTRADGRKVVFSFGFPEGMKVGSNPVLVTAHEPVQMGQAFVPVEDLQLTMLPEMPSMGHGSSGNVVPAHVGGGMYRGAVTFSMAGDWVVLLGLRAGDAQLGEASFAFDL